MHLGCPDRVLGLPVLFGPESCLYQRFIVRNRGGVLAENSPAQVRVLKTKQGFRQAQVVALFHLQKRGGLLPLERRRRCRALPPLPPSGAPWAPDGEGLVEIRGIHSYCVVTKIVRKGFSGENHENLVRFGVHPL